MGHEHACREDKGDHGIVHRRDDEGQPRHDIPMVKAQEHGTGAFVGTKIQHVVFQSASTGEPSLVYDVSSGHEKHLRAYLMKRMAEFHILTEKEVALVEAADTIEQGTTDYQNRTVQIFHRLWLDAHDRRGKGCES